MQSRIDLVAGGHHRTGAPERDRAGPGCRLRGPGLSNTAVEALRTVHRPGLENALTCATPAQRAGALYGACLAAMRLRDLRRRSHSGASWRCWSKVRCTCAAAGLPAWGGAAWRRGKRAAGAGLVCHGCAHSAGGPTHRHAAGCARVAPLRTNPSGSPATNPDAGLAAVAQDLQRPGGWAMGAMPRPGKQLASVYEVQGRTLHAIRAQGEASAAQMDFAALAAFQGGAGTGARTRPRWTISRHPLWIPRGPPGGVNGSGTGAGALNRLPPQRRIQQRTQQAAPNPAT